MERDVENVFRPHQPEILFAMGALSDLGRKSFRTSDTNAGP
jgi:hypothetical protein